MPSDIDPAQTPKFSDSFDRAQIYSMQLAGFQKSLEALDLKFENYMARLDARLEKLADVQAAQNTRVNTELAELRLEISALKAENRFWRWGIVISVAISLLAVFFVMWRT